MGQTWTCFIRIMTKDPFDDQLDIRIIHDRAEVSAPEIFVRLKIYSSSCLTTCAGLYVAFVYQYSILKFIIFWDRVI